MSLDFIPINGRSGLIDYDQFEKDFNQKLQPHCKHAKMFVLNNFPVEISMRVNIAFIIIIAIENRSGSYFRIRNQDGKFVYLKNLIIPVSFIRDLKEEKLHLEDNSIITSDDLFIDFSADIESMKKGLFNYLTLKCQFQANHLFLKPLVFIENHNKQVTEYILSGPVLDFSSLVSTFQYDKKGILNSYSPWDASGGYLNIDENLKQLMEFASQDSQTGYINKNKLARIHKQLSAQKAIDAELGNNLIIINGKPGSGKTSELMYTMIKSLKLGRNILFLTYNKLLTYDIAKFIKTFMNTSSQDTIDDLGAPQTITLHQFFFNISKGLGVLHVLSDARIQDLTEMAKRRMKIIFDYIIDFSDGKDFSWELLKMNIQNHTRFDTGTKEFGINFVKHLKKERDYSTDNLSRHSEKYLINHKKKIVSISVNKVFLADYYSVLDATYRLIKENSTYFEDNNIQDKFDLLEVIYNLKRGRSDSYAAKEVISKSEFLKTRNRKIGGFRKGRILLIDEAQDCHRLEREILMTIFKPKNIVVASGGKEQLIRLMDLCDWTSFQERKILHKLHSTSTTSYRVKSNILEFCNFYAKKYDITLNMTPLNSEDKGELIVDFRKEIEPDTVSGILKELNLRGKINSCLPYESLLVMVDPSTYGEKDANRHELENEEVVINEYGNIVESTSHTRMEWKFKELVKTNGIHIWDGTVEDKSASGIPGALDTRLIFYESCRGLEAWCAACFNLDSFFVHKRDKPEADKYLINDIFYQLEPEKRKSMYAASWVLMALTRAIDTLYLQVGDGNSELGKIIKEFITVSNVKVRLINSNKNESVDSEHRLSQEYLITNYEFFNSLFSTHYPFSLSEVIKFKDKISWGGCVYSFYDSDLMHFYKPSPGISFNSFIEWNKDLIDNAKFQCDQLAATWWDDQKLPLQKEAELRCNEIELYKAIRNNPSMDDGDQDIDIETSIMDYFERKYEHVQFEELNQIIQDFSLNKRYVKAVLFNNTFYNCVLGKITMDIKDFIVLDFYTWTAAHNK